MLCPRSTEVALTSNDLLPAEGGATERRTPMNPQTSRGRVGLCRHYKAPLPSQERPHASSTKAATVAETGNSPVKPRTDARDESLASKAKATLVEETRNTRRDGDRRRNRNHPQFFAEPKTSLVLAVYSRLGEISSIMAAGFETTARMGNTPFSDARHTAYDGLVDLAPHQIA